MRKTSKLKLYTKNSFLPILQDNERKKDRARRKKIRAELRKKEIFRKVKRMKDFAFLRIWHFTSSQRNHFISNNKKKALLSLLLFFLIGGEDIGNLAYGDIGVVIDAVDYLL